MSLNNIEKKSLGYSVLHASIKFWHDLIYYRNYTIYGTHNIPKDKPLIFTPNHSNALMDALAVLFSVKIQFVFLARADIFKKSAIANILYFLKILPIYRERDGNNFKVKSNETFRRTANITTSGNAIVILPEGNHSRFRRLRPLKKGFARIAFSTEEINDFNLDMHIVPVGIDYDDFSKYRSSVIINYGKPIPVSEYIDIYKENPAVALNNIKERLSEHMAPLIVNILSEEYYDLYNELRVIYRSRMANKLDVNVKDDHNRIFIDQQTIRKVEETESRNPEKIKILNEEVKQYTQLKNKLGLSNQTINNSRSSWLSLITVSVMLLSTFPIFLYGLINNILPSQIPIWISNKIKDEQFRSSIKFAVSVFSFPIFYIIQSLIFQAFSHDWLTTLYYILSLPISAALSWSWSRYYLLVKCGWIITVKKITKNKEFIKLVTLYDKIISQTDEITAS